MANSRNQHPVHDEYGELVGYLESSTDSDDIRVLDADGHQLATTRSMLTGKRHLLNLAYNAKYYSSSFGSRR